MNEIKKARRLIEANPHTETAKTLAALVRALESEESFNLGDLYKLNYEHFNLAIDVMKECKARTLAVDAGRTLLLDIDAFLAKANEAGIAVVGFPPADS